MKFIVAIDAPSRYSRPPFGRFAFIQSQGRLVWRKEATDDIERLATLTNEALVFLGSKFGTYKLGIYPWKEVPATAPAPIVEDATPQQPPSEPQDQSLDDEMPVEVPTDPVGKPPEIKKLKVKQT